MRVLDFRLTLFGLTIFMRLLCQYPGAFYWFLLAASFGSRSETHPGKDLFSLTVATTRKAPIGLRQLSQILSFRRWKLQRN